MSLWPVLRNDCGEVVCPFMTAANVNGGRCVGARCGMWRDAEWTEHLDCGYEVTNASEAGVNSYNAGYGFCSLFGETDRRGLPVRTKDFTPMYDTVKEKGLVS